MMNLILSHGSYIGIIVILILTGAGLPLPEEVPVIAAGVLSSHGALDPWFAFFSCLIGALCGDCVMYWIGRHFGSNVVREHPWWARFVHPEREAQLEQMLKDHDVKVFFVARFLVGIRSPVYLAAGVLRMPFRRFIVIDMFCATMVIGTFFGLSYYFGAPIFRWIRGAEYTITGVLILAIATVAAVFFYRRRKKMFAKAALEMLATDPRNEDLTEGCEEADSGPEEESLGAQSSAAQHGRDYCTQLLTDRECKQEP